MYARVLAPNLSLKDLTLYNGADSNNIKNGAVVKPILQTDSPSEFTIQYGKLLISNCHMGPMKPKTAGINTTSNHGNLSSTTSLDVDIFPLFF